MSFDNPKNEGFNVPLDSTTAALVERASGYIGLDKIKFILESIQEKAYKALIADHAD